MSSLMTQKSGNKKPRTTRFETYSKLIPLVPAAEIEIVWNHWLSTFKEHPGRKPELNQLRRAHIAWGIHTFDTQLCLTAITGCANSEWHMGGNPAEKIYNDITLILRDITHTKRFLKIAKDNKLT